MSKQICSTVSRDAKPNSARIFFLEEIPEARIVRDIQYAPILDPVSLVSYEQDGFVVFICVDVEAFEHNHSQITEIGISTLDTTEITNIPPGEGGENSMKVIR